MTKTNNLKSKKEKKIERPKLEELKILITWIKPVADKLRINRIKYFKSQKKTNFKSELFTNIHD